MGMTDKSPAALIHQEVVEAIRLERCNGCGLPRSQWGPVCSGMTQGDWTHFHSPEWWRARRDTRTSALQKMTTAELEESVQEWVDYA